MVALDTHLYFHRLQLHHLQVVALFWGAIVLSQIGRGLVGVAQQWTIGFLLEVLVGVALVDQQ